MFSLLVELHFAKFSLLSLLPFSISLTPKFILSSFHRTRNLVFRFAVFFFCFSAHSFVNFHSINDFLLNFHCLFFCVLLTVVFSFDSHVSCFRLCIRVVKVMPASTGARRKMIGELHEVEMPHYKLQVSFAHVIRVNIGFCVRVCVYVYAFQLLLWSHAR